MRKGQGVDEFMGSNEMMLCWLKFCSVICEVSSYGDCNDRHGLCSSAFCGLVLEHENWFYCF